MTSSMMVNAPLVSSLETFRYIKSPKTLSGSPWLHFPCETNISFSRRLLEVNMSAYGSALRESSRMWVRDDGSIVGTVGGGCVEADVWAAAKEVIVTEQPRKMVFNLNHDAQYDAGLICGGTLEIFVEPVLPQPIL